MSKESENLDLKLHRHPPSEAHHETLSGGAIVMFGACFRNPGPMTFVPPAMDRVTSTYQEMLVSLSRRFGYITIVAYRAPDHLYPTPANTNSRPCPSNLNEMTSLSPNRSLCRASQRIPATTY